MRLSVPSRTALDEPVRIRVSGLAPGVPAAIGIRSEPGWLSLGMFRPDHEGTIDIFRDRSFAGTYVGRSRVGLLWSQLADERCAIHPNVVDPIHSVVTVRQGIGEVSASLTRYVQVRATSARQIRDRGLVGTLFHPSDRPAPPVLVLGGAEGGQNDLAAAMLANAGHAALALTYFGRAGLPPRLGHVPVDYFIEAVDWLLAQPEVSGRRVCVYGNSKGGEAALLVGSLTDRICGVAAIVPSGVVLPDAETGDPAWLPPAGGRLPPPARDRTPDERSAIPVERIAGPVLVASAAHDLVWSPTLADVAARRLVDKCGSRGHVLLRLHGAGHLIQPPYLPTTPQLLPGRADPGLLGGTPAANARAARVCWQHTLAVLRRAAGRLTPRSSAARG